VKNWILPSFLPNKYQELLKETVEEHVKYQELFMVVKEHADSGLTPAGVALPLH
jgi:hypothetical protein